MFFIKSQVVSVTIQTFCRMIYVHKTQYVPYIVAQFSFSAITQELLINLPSWVYQQSSVLFIYSSYYSGLIGVSFFFSIDVCAGF